METKTRRAGESNARVVFVVQPGREREAEQRRIREILNERFSVDRVPNHVDIELQFVRPKWRVVKADMRSTLAAGWVDMHVEVVKALWLGGMTNVEDP